MQILKEFRDFAVKGNVVDLAVGIIIGGAFGKIVESLVKDVMMPPLGYLMGKVDFSNKFLVLNPSEHPAYPTIKAAQEAGETVISYGLFVNAAVNFIIVAFAVFLLVKAINKARAMAEKPKANGPAPAPTTKECPHCCSTIAIKATRCPNCTSTV